MSYAIPSAPVQCLHLSHVDPSVVPTLLARLANVFHGLLSDHSADLRILDLWPVENNEWKALVGHFDVEFVLIEGKNIQGASFASPRRSGGSDSKDIWVLLSIAQSPFIRLASDRVVIRST